ncbi:MAG TPA: SLBB domain-containing protein [Terriglobales bacterium]|nr:SLBB domain-containing protein [Terriglobales bacterium]
MMPKPLWSALFILFAGAVCLAQAGTDSLFQGAAQGASQSDCSDPTLAGTAACSGAQAQRGNSSQSPGNGSAPVRTPVLSAPSPSPGQYETATPAANPSQGQHQQSLPHPETEFEQMVADSVGRSLPLFGQSLFAQPPSTFSPVDWMQVPSDYTIGPGDELQIQIWGQVAANLRVIVDRSGQIYVPQVGPIAVAGIHYGDLESHLKTEIGKMFKNFNVTVNIGRLHSIRVFVVGNARYPGTYTISSLSTLVNAIFASGGPGPQGSLRHVQVRRDGATISDFDFYDLLLKGDKSKDVRLQAGDVLYIPHVGPLVAIAGSVNTPAIYEMKDNSSLRDLIETAGDLSTVADTDKITIDRFVDHQARKTLEFPYDDQSRALALSDGDIVRVFSVVPRFEDTVTLRGNVANPGRYSWKPGMRVRDLIPDAQALLTRRYWLNRAAIVNGRATEYPLRTEDLPDNAAGMNSPPGNGAASADRSNSVNGISDGMDPSNRTMALDAINDQGTSAPGSPRTSNGSSSGNQRSSATEANSNTRNVAEDLRRYAPEINWDYAIIQRVNPVDLTSKLLWISPRKAILERDNASNLELQAGDIVTIFSQRDISVPKNERSQYVIVEGEVMRPGVYKLEVNETLHSVLQRAGGLTPNAYVYGSQLTRESAREDQQKSLNELANMLEVQMRQSAVSIAASSQAGEAPQMLAAQEGIIAQLKNTRASGRVALPVEPKDKTLTDFPDMVLEDSDRLIIPHTPSTVSVVGDVYNPGSFIFQPRNSVEGYLDAAGKGKPQSDLRHAFVLRANGVVVAANNVNGLFVGPKFAHLRLYPGDQIVVPYKLPTGAFVRGLRDWTQISSQLALTAAALAVVH